MMTMLPRLLLAILLALSAYGTRHGQTATIVVSVQSSETAALHLEVLEQDGVTPLSTTIDHGNCFAHGCNAVGTAATMIETVQLDSTAAYTLTAYTSASGGSAQTQWVAIPAYAAYQIYLPIYTP
jgi:hypothetical protein